MNSQLIYAIAHQGVLSGRIEALVRNEWFNDANNPDPMAHIPLESALWAVATNAGVQETVRAAMANEEPGSIEAGNYGKATASITDDDLKQILFNNENSVINRLITPTG